MSTREEDMPSQALSKPNPDPSIYTNEAIERAISGLKDLLKAEIKAQEDVCDEKFKSVDNQFALVERQRVEQKADTEKGVQAALAAAKEAVKEQTAASDKSITKSETSMLENQKQMGITFKAEVKAQSDIVAELKSRVDKMQSAREGAQAQRTETREGISSAQALVGLVVALLAAAALYLGVQRNPEPVVVTPQVTVPNNP